MGYTMKYTHFYVFFWNLKNIRKMIMSGWNMMKWGTRLKSKGFWRIDEFCSFIHRKIKSTKWGARILTWRYGQAILKWDKPNMEAKGTTPDLNNYIIKPGLPGDASTLRQIAPGTWTIQLFFPWCLTATPLAGWGLPSGSNLKYCWRHSHKTSLPPSHQSWVGEVAAAM